MMGVVALLRTLKARSLIVAWAVVVSTVVALAAGLVLPKTYESTAKVLVDSIQKDTITGLYEPRLRVSEFLGQQAAIAGSRAVALETFNTLADEGHIAAVEFEERWRRETGGELVAGNDPRLWAADELLKRLKIEADAVEGTLKITFLSEDPAQAARAANGFAAAYMKTVLDQRQRRAARNAASFSEERQAMERDLEEAQTSLNAFRESQGIVAVGYERLEAAEVELTSLTASIAEARAAAADARSLLAQAQTASREGLLTLPLPESAHAGRSAQERLGLVSAAVARIAERYGEAYPDLVEARREKAALEDDIMQAILDRAEFTERKLAALEREAADKKAQVVELQRVKEAYDILENRVKASRDTYALVANRTLQETLQSRVGNVDVVLLSRATPPEHPATPPLLVIVLIGVAFGAAVGSACAVIVEFAEGRVRDASALRHALRAPVLAEIPYPAAVKRRRKRVPERPLEQAA
jgi:uncharacterized protein involved in exopolysaccharide biosynthesis